MMEGGLEARPRPFVLCVIAKFAIKHTLQALNNDFGQIWKATPNIPTPMHGAYYRCSEGRKLALTNLYTVEGKA
jgi:hypothetical protein